MNKFLLLLICCSFQLFNAKAQTGSLVVITTNRIITDSLRPGIAVYAGDSVISFNASIIIPGGLCLERSYNGNYIWESAAFRSGTIVIIDQVLAVRKGQQVRLPAKKFVIR
ncbi:hypothetical protein BH09BAC5_BH09BAC5_04400 [soil metagenome]